MKKRHRVKAYGIDSGKFELVGIKVRVSRGESYVAVTEKQWYNKLITLCTT